MRLENRIELWNQLQRFELDEPDAPAPFSKRLCSETGWSPEFALRAVQEYKRFLFLTAVAPHRCTPSDIVDTVWHLHLLYTRSYWDDLCGKILKYQLHHEPGNAPKQQEHFKQQYQKTLKSYVAFIGHLPPADIWGALRDEEATTNM